MKRRTFFKLGGMVATSGMLGSCGQAAKKIIPYVVPPDEGINPVEGWYFATTCRLCEAGCGIMIRTVDGRAKKVEGNPHHPINSGSTCARGQAAVQQLYHPERVRQPLQRVGAKGTNKFQPVSWEKAIELLAEKIGGAKGPGKAFVMANSSSDVTAGISNRLLRRLDSDFFVAPSHAGYETYEKASEPFHPTPSLPYHNIKEAKFVLFLGADILESGFSMAHYGNIYGHMRRGDPARRGTMVYVGTRVSLTAANADKFIGVRPGVLGILAMGLAHEVLQMAVDKRLLRFVPLSTQGRWLTSLEEYSVKKVSDRTGISEEMIEKLSAKFVEGSPAMAVAGDDVAAYSNGLGSLKAVEFLNLISEQIARTREALKPMGMPEFNPRLQYRMKHFFGVKRDAHYLSTFKKVLNKASAGNLNLGIMINTNPVYDSPASLKVKEALAKVPFVAYIGQFLNDTTEYADLVLPEHHFLESWSAQVPEYPHGVPILNLQQPVINPLYDTRPAGDILVKAANKAGMDLGVEGSEAYVKQIISQFRAEWPEVSQMNDIQAWELLLSRGGWWSEKKAEEAEPSLSTDQLWEVAKDLKVDDPVFPDSESHPFYLHPYSTITMGDGSVANLPWLQEMPEPMTTVSWGSWVEINPKTARSLGIEEGDILKITSKAGSIEAPAYIYPGISPDTVAIPFGYGHRSFGKYASGRGANANSLIEADNVNGAEDLAWRSVRVNIKKTGERAKLVRNADPKGQYRGDVFQL